MKNIKIYSDKEIESPQAHLERKGRRFWNKKAKQLVKSPKTWLCNKTTIVGIINVSWKMKKKTALIEGEARKLLEDEKELFWKDEPTSVSKLRQQKRKRWEKNLEDMAVAHEAIERHDANIEIYKKVNDTSALKREKDLMDGAYSQLKKAQEAAAKSIKFKGQQVQMRLTSKNTRNGVLR